MQQINYQALSQNSQNATYLNCKGMSLYYLNKFEKASDCFQNAIKLNPNLGDTYANLGIVNQQLEQLEDAIEFLKISIGLDQENYYYLAYLGYIYYKKNLFNKAVDTYDKCLLMYNKYQSTSTKNILLTLLIMNIPYNEKHEECYKKSLEVRKIFIQV